jgi:regulator of protease activity HflC (stomatin/prohibitin superfamily)
MIGYYILGIVIFFVALFLLAGIRIVRPTHKMLIETLGRYKKTAQQGFHWIIPVIQSEVYVNITEQMVDVQPQTVITKDNLNANVDAVVYYQIKNTIKAAYNVDNHESQLTSLARTTLRAVIGTMSLTYANENRDDINSKVEAILDKETNSYGVEVLRVEIQKIEPPQDVQESMNEVVKAERKKIAAKDFANAVEIEADGKRRANIKEAEGIAQGKIIVAKGEADRIRLVNEAANKYFVGNAVKLRELDVSESALKDNAKIVLTEKGINPQIIMGDIPVKQKRE